jgi:hypothetical protein
MLLTPHKATLNILILIGFLIAFITNACTQVTNSANSDKQAIQVNPQATTVSKVMPPTATAIPSPKKTDTPTSIPTATPTLTPKPTATPTPNSLCKKPAEDYARVKINGETTNHRTELMLDWAMKIYGGPGDLKRIAQGSYTDELEASFGTHAGGGVVDISIRNPAKLEERLFGEVEAMIFALRHAGFAAWFREADSVYSGSAPHIHAVAIGDKELSPAAKTQLTGASGYFRGLDGLPSEYGGPNPDPHGTPVICPWMNELGYYDLRGTPQP